MVKHQIVDPGNRFLCRADDHTDCPSGQGGRIVRQIFVSSCRLGKLYLSTRIRMNRDAYAKFLLMKLARTVMGMIGTFAGAKGWKVYCQDFTP